MTVAILSLRRCLTNTSGHGKAEHDQDMTIARTMTAIDLKLTPPKGLTSDERRAWDAYYEPRNTAFRAAGLVGNDLVSWKYQRYMHDYLGCVKAVDDSVGQILKFLVDDGLADNTIVVYSSDQGFYLGEHGWFDKPGFLRNRYGHPSSCAGLALPKLGP